MKTYTKKEVIEKIAALTASMATIQGTVEAGFSREVMREFLTTFAVGGDDETMSEQVLLANYALSAAKVATRWQSL